MLDVPIESASAASAQNCRRHRMPRKAVQTLKNPRVIRQIIGHAPIETKTIVCVVWIANNAYSETHGNLVERIKADM